MHKEYALYAVIGLSEIQKFHAVIGNCHGTDAHVPAVSPTAAGNQSPGRGDKAYFNTGALPVSPKNLRKPE